MNTNWREERFGMLEAARDRPLTPDHMKDAGFFAILGTGPICDTMTGAGRDRTLERIARGEAQ